MSNQAYLAKVWDFLHNEAQNRGKPVGHDICRHHDGFLYMSSLAMALRHHDTVARITVRPDGSGHIRWVQPKEKVVE